MTAALYSVDPYRKNAYSDRKYDTYLFTKLLVNSELNL